MKGIEPSCLAWEAGVLPLNYTRIEKEGNGDREWCKVKRPSPDKVYIKPRGSYIHGTGQFYHGITRKAAELPAAQLFGERAARAVGDIPETEVFVDLE